MYVCAYEVTARFNSLQ